MDIYNEMVFYLSIYKKYICNVRINLCVFCEYMLIELAKL